MANAPTALPAELTADELELPPMTAAERAAVAAEDRRIAGAEARQ